MKFLGFKNLSKHIRNSDEKGLRKKAFIRFQVEAFLVPLIINVLYFFARIDDAEALKHSIINGLTAFSILEILIVFHVMPVKNKEIKRTVMRANNELDKMGLILLLKI